MKTEVSHPDLSRRLALRPREAAEALGVSERTLRKWMRDSGLPHFRRDGTVLIPTVSLENWMAEQVSGQNRSEQLVEEILGELGETT